LPFLKKGFKFRGEKVGKKRSDGMVDFWKEFFRIEMKRAKAGRGHFGIEPVAEDEAVALLVAKNTGTFLAFEIEIVRFLEEKRFIHRRNGFVEAERKEVSCIWVCTGWDRDNIGDK
jgi:hypothetical protein